jgi:hypothetical protein
LSRTLKDRPHWVRRNDPTVEKFAKHDHKVVLREKIGEEPVMRRAYDRDGWHSHDEVEYYRPLFKRWVETVPCTIDVPEEGTSSWRFRRPRSLTNDELRNEKNCYWNLEYYPGGPSGKPYKRLTHGAERSKVHTQLHNAVRDNGRWVEDLFWLKYLDEDEMPDYPWPEYIRWEEVDVKDDSKYASRGWWDW